MRSLADTVSVTAVPAVPGWCRRLAPRVRSARGAPSGRGALRRVVLVAACVAAAPSHGGGRAGTCDGHDRVRWSGAEAGELCPVTRAIREVAPGLSPGDRRFSVVGADGRALAVDLSPAGRVRQVTLDGHRCVAEACRGVTVRWEVSALDARVDHVFEFAGTALAPPDGGRAVWRLSGRVKVPAQ
jgi:hypothetical protein